MSEVFRQKNIVKLPQPRTEREEFGKAKRGLLICKRCGAYYYQKSWHHDAAGFMAKRKGKIFHPKFAECPACALIRHGLYEGKIIISGIPAKFLDELLRLIRGYCKRAEAKDSLDRLIAIEKTGDMIVVTVTENQLAAKLAHKIKEVFKHHIKSSVAYSKSPSDVGFVRMLFH